MSLTYLQKIIFSPLLIGILAGLIANNLQLGIYATALILLWKVPEKLAVFLIPATVFAVDLSGNINFEIVFILTMTLFLLLAQFDLTVKYFFLMTVLISLAGPYLGELLGLIPAGLLDQINKLGILFNLLAVLFTLSYLLNLFKEAKDLLPAELLKTAILLPGLIIPGGYLLPLWAGYFILQGGQFGKQRYFKSINSKQIH